MVGVASNHGDERGKKESDHQEDFEAGSKEFDFAIPSHSYDIEDDRDT